MPPPERQRAERCPPWSFAWIAANRAGRLPPARARPTKEFCRTVRPPGYQPDGSNGAAPVGYLQPLLFANLRCSIPHRPSSLSYPKGRANKSSNSDDASEANDEGRMTKPEIMTKHADRVTWSRVTSSRHSSLGFDSALVIRPSSFSLNLRRNLSSAIAVMAAPLP